MRSLLGWLWVLTWGAAAWGQAPLSRTVLVLPFSNGSDVAQLDWVGEGISENIRESLAAAGMLVLEREERQEGWRRLSIRPNAPISRATALRMGHALDADLLVYGEFSMSAEPNSRGYLKVSAQVIDLEKMSREAEVLQGARLEELARLQQELSFRVLAAVAPELAGSRESFGERMPAIRLEALEYFVQGLVEDRAEEKLKYWQAAVRMDARFSQARFVLGRLLYQRRSFREAAEALERIPASHAHYADSVFLKGLAYLGANEPVRAAGAFAKALEIAPLGEVHNNLGVAWSRQNDLTKAREQFERALEGDANDPEYRFNLAYVLWRQGKAVDCLTHVQAMLERVPEDVEARELLGMCERPEAGAAVAAARDPQWVGRERVKQKFEERAYRQLKALVEGARKKEKEE